MDNIENTISNHFYIGVCLSITTVMCLPCHCLEIVHLASLFQPSAVMLLYFFVFRHLCVNRVSIFLVSGTETEYDCSGGSICWTHSESPVK
jgi:hypothetical protein